MNCWNGLSKMETNLYKSRSDYEVPESFAFQFQLLSFNMQTKSIPLPKKRSSKVYYSNHGVETSRTQMHPFHLILRSYKGIDHRDATPSIAFFISLCGKFLFNSGMDAWSRMPSVRRNISSQLACFLNWFFFIFFILHNLLAALLVWYKNVDSVINKYNCKNYLSNFQQYIVLCNI